MTQAQFEVRKDRSENGALIASATEEGFRVYAVRNPSKVYLVKQDGDSGRAPAPTSSSTKATPRGAASTFWPSRPGRSRKKKHSPSKSSLTTRLKG